MRLWSLYCDLEENFGSFESTCSAYGNLFCFGFVWFFSFDLFSRTIDEMMRVKVATPQTILNYAAYLEAQVKKIHD